MEFASPPPVHASLQYRAITVHRITAQKTRPKKHVYSYSFPNRPPDTGTSTTRHGTALCGTAGLIVPPCRGSGPGTALRRLKRVVPCRLCVPVPPLARRDEAAVVASLAEATTSPLPRRGRRATGRRDDRRSRRRSGKERSRCCAASSQSTSCRRC
jgi:hypothetical protein